jgi:anaerobic magnesium-protoporphyrin IX monomethyl ester cyclase
MKIWICSPMATFFAPQQGAARLNAYLLKEGHAVSLKDLNQDTFFGLMSKDNLERAWSRLRLNVDSLNRNIFLRENIGSILLRSSAGAIRELAAKGILKKRNSAVFQKSLFGLVKRNLNSGNIYYALLSEKNFVLAEIDKAREILDKGFFSLEAEEFMRCFYTLLCGKAIIDAAFFPAQLDFGLGFCGTAYSPRAGDILRAVREERYNYLIPHYRNTVMPMFMREQPDIVGISITHMSEFIPALTLAYQMKSARPEVHITLGGAMVTEESARLAGNQSLWEMFDSLVSGPGELPFSQLIETLESKGELSGVPNLLYKEKGAVKKSLKDYEFDINEACTPVFAGLRPKSGLPLETASGCYWGKCIFCFYPRQGTAGLNPEHQKKRIRNIELVLDDIRQLKEKYDPVTIGFTDSAMSPQRLEQIAEFNLKSEKKVQFSAFMRFEKDFKSLDFCRKLAAGGFLGGQVGLESGCQRVNNIINKGVDLSDARLILENLSRTGILIHLYTMIGLPGETAEETALTYAFLRRWHKKLPLGWQIYPLMILEHSALAERAAEFEIATTALPADVLAQAMQFKVKNGLSQEQSMGLLINYSEKLKKLAHPLNRILDIESLKLVLLYHKVKGIRTEKARLVHLKI